MKSRRAVATLTSVGLAASVAVAVPLATAKSGSDDRGEVRSSSKGKVKSKVKGKKHRRGHNANLQLAVLNGRNEVNPETNRRRAGDLNGFGQASVTIKNDTVCFAVVVQGIGDVTAAHIHMGGKRTNGPVVLDLQPPAGTTGDPGAFSGCLVDNGGAYDVGLDLAKLRRRPGKFYVNVHTAEFPNGAIRGQLRKISPRKG